MLVAVLLLGRVAQSRALEEQRTAALERAQAYAGVVAGTLGNAPDGRLPPARFRELGSRLGSAASADPATERILLFTSEGAVLFSTDAPTRGDLEPVTPGAGFEDAVAGRLVWRIDAPPPEMLVVDIPLVLEDGGQPVGVVQVDVVMRGLREQARGSWPTLELFLGLLLLVTGTLAVMSFRRGKASEWTEEAAEDAVAAPVPASRRAALDAVDEVVEPETVAEEPAADMEPGPGPEAETEAAPEPEPEPEPDPEPGPEREIEPEVDGEGTLVRANLTPVEDKPQLSEEEVNDLRSRLAKAAASRKQSPV